MSSLTRIGWTVASAVKTSVPPMHAIPNSHMGWRTRKCVVSHADHTFSEPDTLAERRSTAVSAWLNQPRAAKPMLFDPTPSSSRAFDPWPLETTTDGLRMVVPTARAAQKAGGNPGMKRSGLEQVCGLQGLLVILSRLEPTGHANEVAVSEELHRVVGGKHRFGAAEQSVNRLGPGGLLVLRGGKSRVRREGGIDLRIAECQHHRASSAG